MFECSNIEYLGVDLEVSISKLLESFIVVCPGVVYSSALEVKVLMADFDE